MVVALGRRRVSCSACDGLGSRPGCAPPLLRPPWCPLLSPASVQVICPSDTELCELHGEQLEELAGFKRRHLASQAWHQFCERHGVQQAQPEAQQPASGA